MKTGDDKDIVSVPPALLAEIQAAAREEQRSTDDVVQDAVERYLENRRWLRLLAFGEAQARSLGLAEPDVQRLISESRHESRQGR